MVRPIISYVVLTAFGLFVLSIFWPLPNRARGNARRSHCQSNLKQIGLSVLQYAQDNDDHLPSSNWATSVAKYAKTNVIFQCPSTANYTPGTNDYFYKAQLIKARTRSIDQPALLILGAEGIDDSPLNVTLSRFPAPWRKDEKSPAWRHLDTANYLFVDGHVKSLKNARVPTNFLLP